MDWSFVFPLSQNLYVEAYSLVWYYLDVGPLEGD